MRPRPLDFFGPEDYDGSEHPDVTIARIREAQREWDKERAALPWWKRIFT